MDDQEILKLMKFSGKKKRSQNCLISSSSLTKENFKMEQFLGGENTTVYAWVEVSKDSDKPAKREKIPLNNKDFLRVIQKFMISQKIKNERKILKPSKRKHVTESASATTNISKEEKNIHNDALAYQTFGFTDEPSLIYKRSNPSVVEKSRGREKNRLHRRLHSGDHYINETGHQQLKILFNRNTFGIQEPKVKRERIGPISRGTNTDIVQTPKVLEALQALTLNFDTEKSGGNHHDKKHICFNEKDAHKSLSSAAQNFLFVPFIITNSQLSSDQQSGSHCIIKQKYVARGRTECSIKRPLTSNDDDTEKCATDNQSEISSVNTDKITEISANLAVKNATEVEEKGGVENKSNYIDPLVAGKEVCLLQEVKTLQQRINAIVEGLETNNFMCLHNLDNEKSDHDVLSSEVYNTDETEQLSKPGCDNKKSMEKQLVSGIDYLDCGVQAMIVKCYCDKMVTVPSGTFIKSIANRLVQFPSEVNIRTRFKRERLELSKSSPILQTKIEKRYMSIKRASSLMTVNRRIENSEYLAVKKFNMNCEVSPQEDCDHFHEDSDVALIKKRKRDEPHRSEKSTNILFKKNDMTLMTENDKDNLVMVKQCGKVAKIKIVGNTTLFTENRDSGVGKIKLELNELGSIKISNKFSRKSKAIDNCNDNNNDNNNLEGSNSKMPDTNIRNCLKDDESNKKPVGKEAVNKVAKREIIQKRVEVAKPTGSNAKTFAKDTDSSHSSPRVSKLKQPSTPVRMRSRGRDDGFDTAKSPRFPSPKMDDNQSAKTPRFVKSAEKINEKKNFASLIPKKQLQNPAAIPQNDKLDIGKPPEEVLVKSETPNADKSSPVKSIWALTKVLLYEDGSQSFEVLEASTHPIKCHSNKIIEKNDSNDSAMSMKTNIIDNKNNSHSAEKRN